MRCNRCYREMTGTTAYDGACACGGLIEATPERIRRVPQTREEWDAYHAANDRSYNIVRFYFRGGRRLIEARVTLNEAQAHCHDPETSSKSCTNKTGRARTRRLGAWFDGYESR